MCAKATSVSKNVDKTTGRAPRQAFTPVEKCRAVLSVWTEQRSMSELQNALNISWTQLNSWQDLALDGMLQALTPKTRATDSTPALSGKLQKLLAKRGLTEEPPTDVTPALEKRLSQIQHTGKKQNG